MPVNLKGKQYHTVAERVIAFRESCPAQEGWGIATTIYAIDDAVCIVHATITDPSGRVIGQGLAEEVRSKTGVNSTSALENCETSAVGRALAASGWGGGGEYASADEVAGAIHAQTNGQTTQAARAQQRPVETNGKQMSDKQRELIRNLAASHVFTPEEKRRFGDWAKGDRSAISASATIDRMRAVVAEREAAEKASASAEWADVSEELPFA
jgi:hypothetical protein